MMLNFREVSPDTKCTCSRNDRFLSQMTESLVWPNICTKKDSNESLPKGMFFAYGWIEREITLNQIPLISFLHRSVLTQKIWHSKVPFYTKVSLVKFRQTPRWCYYCCCMQSSYDDKRQNREFCCFISSIPVSSYFRTLAHHRNYASRFC